MVEIGGHLGRGLSNLVNLFNPSAVILDGRLALAGDALLEQVVQIIRRQALAHSSNGLTVRFAQLGNEGSLLGAGLMVLDKYFEIPMLKPPHFLIEPQADMAGVPR